MSRKVDIARAWRDPEYRATLSPEELKALPPSPAGVVELNSTELESVNGGTWYWDCTESPVCEATTMTGIECCIGNHSETLLRA